MSRYSLLLTATACLYVCSLARKVPRVFSEDFIEGLYGRFFEFVDQGNTVRCPRTIDHFNRGRPSALGNSWIIPHNKIVQQGARCDDGEILMLNSFDNYSTVPDQLRESQIAEQTFTIMRDESTGFWMGVDGRRCGRWVFPYPSYVFFVREFDRTISSFFNLELAPGKKYMFVVAPAFTCIYEDITRPTPQPNVVIDAHEAGSAIPQANGTTGGTGSDIESGAELNPAETGTGSSPIAPTSTPTASTPSTSVPGSSGNDADGDGSSEGASQGSGSASDSDTSAPSTGSDDDAEQGDREPPSTGDDELSIIDIAEGAQPPVQSPEDDDVSIVDIATEEGDDSGPGGDAADSNEEPAEAEDGSSDEASSDGGDSDVSSVFDVDDEVSAIEAQAGDSLCFAGDSLVELRGGALVRMRELAVGDEVRVGSGEFSTVFTFTHRMAHKWALFIELETECGKTVQLTPGHLIYCNGDLMQAGNVAQGDVLWTGQGSRTKVTRVSRVQRRGIYNPQTLQGNIVVNGIVASTFTKAVQAGAAQGLLAPVRAWWRTVKLDGFRGQLEEHMLANSLREWLQPMWTRVEL